VLLSSGQELAQELPTVTIWDIAGGSASPLTSLILQQQKMLCVAGSCCVCKCWLVSVAALSVGCLLLVSVK
jgi:hypothetical protein